MSRIKREQLLRLQNKYKTDAAIGTIFGITRQAVHQLRMKHNVPSVAERNMERNRKIKEMFNKGISSAKLAAKNGISISQVYRILNEFRERKQDKA